MDAIILCGGYGTRLKKISKGVPKPLVKINRLPFIEYLINNLLKNSISNIYLATSYKSFLFKKLFKKKKNIHIVKEKVKIGTGGAIVNCLIKKKKISKNVIILNGDSYNFYNYIKFIEFHKKKKSKFSILIKKKEKTGDKGNILINNKNEIISFVEKKKTKNKISFFNAGVYVVNKKFFLKYFSKIKYLSLEYNLIPELIKTSKVFGFQGTGRFIDIGTPKNYFLFKKIIKWKK